MKLLSYINYLVRQFGTNNLPDCSNMCHESSGIALSETLGIAKGSVTLDDFKHADLVSCNRTKPWNKSSKNVECFG